MKATINQKTYDTEKFALLASSRNYPFYIDGDTSTFIEDALYKTDKGEYIFIEQDDEQSIYEICVSEDVRYKMDLLNFSDAKECLQAIGTQEEFELEFN